MFLDEVKLDSNIIISHNSIIQHPFDEFNVSADYHRKRQRDDDRYGRDNSRRNSDHESRRDTDQDMRPVINRTFSLRNLLSEFSNVLM